MIRPSLLNIKAIRKIPPAGLKTTNALDQNDRMSFIQKQVGHTMTRMIVDHYSSGKVTGST